MLSAKTLFLGVYTQRGILRPLFLPLCYLLISSPFALLAFQYFGLFKKGQDYVPKNFITPDIWPLLFVSIVTVCLATRFISGSNSVAKDGGKRRVQLLPYWIPGVRHWGNVVFGGERWLKSVRDTSIANVVAYNRSGTKHNIILSSALLDQILGNTDSFEEAELTKWILLHNAFGLPRNAKAQYLELQPELSRALEREIFKGSQLKKITSAFVRSLSEALPDLVTFNSSIVDQLPWERVAGIELTDGTDEVECDLFALINEFFCNAIFPPIIGPQFPESYELLASDLATFNQSFYALSLGLPRFFPLPGLPRALLAKKRLLQNLTRLFKDLTNPPAKRVFRDDESLSGEEDTDADTPTPFTALNDVFSQHNLPIPARAAIALELLHRLASKAIPLAFWTILHIYQQSAPATDKLAAKEDLDQTPLQQIRKETQTWAKAVQPPSIHPSFPAPPAISFTSPAPLFNPSSLTYLRSCIFESRRVYSSSIATAQITKPIIFTENSIPGNAEEWQLDTGSYIDIGLSERLINTSPAEYLSPGEYSPNRYAHSQSPAPLSASIFDDSEELVTAMLVALVAGITQLWEIAAAPKKGFWEQMQEAQAAATGQAVEAKEGEKKRGVWVLPRAVEGASVMLPRRDVRVRIRRREGLEGMGSGR